METLTHEPAQSATDKPDPECVVCGSRAARFLFTKDAYPVFRCRSCGVEFLNPQPDDAVLASIYGPDYFLGSRSPEGDERIARMKAATARRYLDSVAGSVKEGRRRLLEVGCGTGDLLVEAMSRGFEIRGVEVSASSVETANRRIGTEVVQQGTLETADIPDAFFDVVIACDVVEHVRSPQSFLEGVHACLKPGGMLFLITPSRDSFSRLVLGRHWMEYKREHLFYFGKFSLRHLLQRSGFSRVTLSPNTKVLSLAYVNDHFQRFPVPGCSLLLKILTRGVPESIRVAHFTVPASGLMATAWKEAGTSASEVG